MVTENLIVFILELGFLGGFGLLVEGFFGDGELVS
jgi:hypothetical protein